MPSRLFCAENENSREPFPATMNFDSKVKYRLILLLLNTTCPVLANSVDPDQLASGLDHHCLSLNCEFLSKARIK